MSALHKRVLFPLAVWLLGVGLLLSGCSPTYHSYDDLFSYTQILHTDGSYGRHEYTDDPERVDILHSLVSDYPIKLKDNDTIYIFTENQSLVDHDLEKIPSIAFLHNHVIEFEDKDYNDIFVIFTSRSVTYNTLDFINVTDVWQDDTTVYVRAQFVTNYLQHVNKTMPFLQYSWVKVERSKMTKYGKLKFILIDDYGKERASTTAVILPPENQEETK